MALGVRHAATLGPRVGPEDEVLQSPACTQAKEEEVTLMPKVSDRPWSSIPKTAEAYGGAKAFCEACLIDLNPPGEEKKATLCKLPVREPDGAINRNALAAAAAALVGARGGVDAPLEAKRKAARKLVRLYRQAEMEPPASLKRLAGEPSE